MSPSLGPRKRACGEDLQGLTWVAAFATLKGLTQALNNSKTAPQAFIARPMGQRLSQRLLSKLLALDLQRLSLKPVAFKSWQLFLR